MLKCPLPYSKTYLFHLNHSIADNVARAKAVFRGDGLGHGSIGTLFIINSDTVIKTTCRYETHPSGYAEEERYSLRRVRGKCCL